MELLDVYDNNGNPTGRKIVRGDKSVILNENEHIAVAVIFIENNNHEFLIQKTSKEKGGHFSSTGGHVDSGETPLETIKREVYEELGINIEKDNIVDYGGIKQKGLLEHIITHCEIINQKTSKISKERFALDEDIKQIVCFNILQIGELVAHLDEPFQKEYSGMPWGDIVGMRNHVVHGYDTIDIDEVWKTSIYNIGPLMNYCREILDKNIL